MNARSRYVTVNEVQETDRRGATRTIKVKTGFAKGKRYPYSSKRQDAARPGR